MADQVEIKIPSRAEIEEIVSLDTPLKHPLSVALREDEAALKDYYHQYIQVGKHQPVNKPNNQESWCLMIYPFLGTKIDNLKNSPEFTMTARDLVEIYHVAQPLLPLYTLNNLGTALSLAYASKDHEALNKLQIARMTMRRYLPVEVQEPEVKEYLFGQLVNIGNTIQALENVHYVDYSIVRATTDGMKRSITRAFALIHSPVQDVS